MAGPALDWHACCVCWPSRGRARSVHRLADGTLNVRVLAGCQAVAQKRGACPLAHFGPSPTACWGRGAELLQAIVDRILDQTPHTKWNDAGVRNVGAFLELSGLDERGRRRSYPWRLPVAVRYTRNPEMGLAVAVTPGGQELVAAITDANTHRVIEMALPSETVASDSASGAAGRSTRARKCLRSATRPSARSSARPHCRARPTSRTSLKTARCTCTLPMATTALCACASNGSQPRAELFVTTFATFLRQFSPPRACDTSTIEFDSDQSERSKRSRFMTLFQTATKSLTNFSCEPSQA